MGLIAGISFNEKFKNLYPSYFDTTNSKYILIDNMYVSSFLVVNYNQEMEGGFLDKI